MQSQLTVHQDFNSSFSIFLSICVLFLEILYTSLKFPFYHLQSPILLPYVKTSP